MEDRHMTLDDARASGNLVVFAGAAVSAGPPACLPLWWDVNKEVLHSLAHVVAAVPRVGSRALELADELDHRQESGAFPPEWQAELLVRRYRANYFEVLRLLDGDLPGRSHLAIAALARSKGLQAIITTNFDRLIEAALDATGVSYEVLIRPADFGAWLERRETDCLPLVKLHGSAGDTSTLIDTLSQRLRPAAAETVALLRHFLRTTHWLFVGFSGADLDANPEYLQLAAEAPRAIGLTWLVRQGAKPRESVSKILSFYEKRGELVEGVLPQFLESLLDRWEVPRLRPPRELTEDEVSELKRQAKQRVEQHVAHWVDTMPSGWAALMFADLVAATGHPSDALMFLEAVRHSTLADHLDDLAAAAISMTVALLVLDTGDVDRGGVLVDDALRQLSGTDDEEQLQRALTNLVYALARQNQLLDALNLAMTCKHKAEDARDREWQSATLHNLAFVYDKIGRYEDAIAEYLAAARLSEEIGDGDGRATALNNVGELLLRRGDADRAEVLLEDALKLRQRLGQESQRAHTLGNLAGIKLARGDIGAARIMYVELLSTFERLGERTNELTTLRNLGEVERRAGRYDEALAFADKALEESRILAESTRPMWRGKDR
jgi:tetratricopeptide (TPR) repeat protein